MARKEKKNACRVLARKPEGKRPSGGVGIEVDLMAIRRKGKERTDHTQNRDKQAGCDETSDLICRYVHSSPDTWCSHTAVTLHDFLNPAVNTSKNCMNETRLSLCICYDAVRSGRLYSSTGSL